MFEKSSFFRNIYFLFVLIGATFTLGGCEVAPNVFNSEAINPRDTGAVAAPKVSLVTPRVPNSGGSELFIDIEGENLGGEGWKAELKPTVGTSIQLQTQSISATAARLAINAGEVLAEGLFSLIVTNAYGQSSVQIATLKGDQGIPGTQGLKGDAGIAGPQGPSGIANWSEFYTIDAANPWWLVNNFMLGGIQTGVVQGRLVAIHNSSSIMSTPNVTGNNSFYLVELYQKLDAVISPDVFKCEYRLLRGSEDRDYVNFPPTQYYPLKQGDRSSLVFDMGDYELRLETIYDIASSEYRGRVKLSSMYGSDIDPAVAKTHFSLGKLTTKFRVQKRCSE